MAQDFDELFFDFSIMSDDEIYSVVAQHLREYPNLDADSIDVSVRDGFVTLSGRVGSDGEKQVAEKALVDVLGVEQFANDLVVSELYRGMAPEAADEAVALDREVDDQLGEPDPNQTDTAEHLHEDLEAQTFGTHDVGEAIAEGATYVPPDRPIAEGYDSEEDH